MCFSAIRFAKLHLATIRIHFSHVHSGTGEMVYFSGRTPVVDFWIEALVKAKIRFVLEILHGDTSAKRVTSVVR